MFSAYSSGLLTSTTVTPPLSIMIFASSDEILWYAPAAESGVSEEGIMPTLFAAHEDRRVIAVKMKQIII